MTEPYEIVKVKTQPFLDQNPGTSGLRKKTKIFMQEHYTENFIQSILNSISQNEKSSGRPMIIGGDGRFLNNVVLQKIIQILAGNKVRKIMIAKDGILSTPAASCVIRKCNAIGGIILTASHNPAGLDADFGIKFNISNGGAAPEQITKSIYEISRSLNEYKLVPNLKIKLDSIGDFNFTIYDKINGQKSQFDICVFDGIQDYFDMLSSSFDFQGLNEFIRTGYTNSIPLKIRVDCLNGVTGPYAKKILSEILGVSHDDIVKSVPIEDFGGLHPDPNLVHAKELVDFMKNGDYDIGAAFDGDGDRHMIVGKEGFFVTPSDSVAVVTRNASSCIPYFEGKQLLGVARSMPTSEALDKVAKSLNISYYEVPTGWKYFGNLMDAQKLSICGEESFGMGCNVIREKDGIWSLLAWLSVMMYHKKGIPEIIKEHWKSFGRNYYQRLDYENLTAEEGCSVINYLKKMIDDKSFVSNNNFRIGNEEFTITSMDNFTYIDPVDGSISENQGIRIYFQNSSRIVYRLSGTGSSGATLRIYIEKFENCDGKMDEPVREKLQNLTNLSIQIADLQNIIARTEPSVIT